MKVVLAAVGLAIVSSLAAAIWLGVRARTLPERTGPRGSIMDAAPERMSLFSADHVRMLSEAQLRALENDEGDQGR